MKHISYSFSNSDIEAITFALTVLPSLGIEETEAQAAINYQCCFEEVYNKWSAEYFPTLKSKSSARTVIAAYKYCKEENAKDFIRNVRTVL